MGVVGNWNPTQTVKRARLDEICTLLGYNATFSDDSSPTFRYHPAGQSSRSSDVSGKPYVRGSGNIGKETSLYAA